MPGDLVLSAIQFHVCPIHRPQCHFQAFSSHESFMEIIPFQIGHELSRFSPLELEGILSILGDLDSEVVCLIVQRCGFLLKEEVKFMLA